MPLHCVCYVVDDNYLFPTLLSSSQARAYLPKDMADVVIICLSNTAEKIDLVRPVAREIGVEIIHAAPEAIDNLHPMYGRLFINRILPPIYQRVVYVDGDTQIRGSLAPLLQTDIPAGKFLAVRDPAGMFARLSAKWMERTVADRKAAGLTGSYDDYLNTGLLVFDLKEWEELSSLTLEKIKARDDSFKFGDQDPMNLAIGDRCLFIPNKWNFPGFLIGTNAEGEANPIVYHFMSNPRPWLHGGLPWGRKWQKPYEEFLARFPVLRKLAPTLSNARKLRNHAQQILKVTTEYKPVSQIKETAPHLVI